MFMVEHEMLYTPSYEAMAASGLQPQIDDIHVRYPTS